MSMTARTNPFAATPQLAQQLIDYGRSLIGEGLEPGLIKLVAMRTCQINGSATGLLLHVADARKLGESDERLDLLSVWRDAYVYSDRERAALGWTEALTRLPDTGAPDEDYAPVKAHFSEEEEVRLTMLICLINTFNRVAVGHRLAPLPPQRQAA
jgi:AhpD family alkylhydroperoxidase